MKTLRNVVPTPEQAVVVDDATPEYWLIRGAAGSGKTTTSLLRLKFLVRYWRDRREDLGLTGPVRVLVLTFNRTLRGYIDELAREQIQAGPEVDLEISTFGGWSQKLLGRVILSNDPRAVRLSQLAGDRFPWSREFCSSTAILIASSSDGASVERSRISATRVFATGRARARISSCTRLAAAFSRETPSRAASLTTDS
jgi:hypothetical protein